MASSSSSSSSQSKYDVFLSFRGEDTRRSFTTYLYDALCQKNILTFLDDEEIRRGDKLSPTLLNAIEGSKISLIIFSENYASSRWCLDELVKIMECKKSKQQIVIPVFYNIDPSHVRKQEGPYEAVFIEHEKNHQSKVQKWRMALREAADSAGRDSSNIMREVDLVKSIVEDVLKKLNDVSGPQRQRGLVGIQKSIEDVESLLCIESADVRIIGLWGMGGIGKTTLAKVLFKELFSRFEGCCFVENVREEWKKRGEHGIRKKLLTEVLGDHRLYISTYNITSTYEENRLQRRKVLIVLDDVSDLQQMERLAGDKNRFGPGSRIIVTTRDKNVLKKKIDGLYEVKPLSGKEALQLFSLKAFQKDHPTSGFTHLSEAIINYAKGVPLVLEVLGSLLYSKSPREREWESTLQKLKKVPNAEIHRVLRLSFEELDYEEQIIFLDIACCMKGLPKYRIKSVLDGCGFSTNLGIRSLQDKSLITISNDETVSMHDLIQEMGWQIVREESMREFGKRSRLWDPVEIYHIFKHEMGTDNSIESIMLNMADIKDVEISPTTFSRMRKLRLLNFYMPYESTTFKVSIEQRRSSLKLSASPEDRRSLRLQTSDDKGLDNKRPNNRCNLRISRGLEFLPDELRFLCWDRFPLKALPSSFNAEMLVELHLRSSLVEKLWDGEQELANLKALGLNGSRHLKELPDLSRAKHLEVMILEGCSSLKHVPSSIFSLDSLKVLNLNECKELQCIRSDMNSKSLLNLSLGGCSNLVQFSVTSEKLEYLDLHGTAIEELPLSLGQCKNLLCLDLHGCRRLKDLPDNFFHVGSGASVSFTETLAPVFDTSFSKLPNSLSLFSELHELNLSGTNIEILPESIKFVSQLRKLNVAYCIKLRFLPELPPSLQKLDTNMCIFLESVSSSPATAILQNSFSSQNKGMLLKQIQDSKISLLCDDYWEWFEFLNTNLEENARKTIMDEAVIRIKHAAFLSSMVQPFIDPYHQFELLSTIYGPEPEAIENTFCQIWLWNFQFSPFTVKFNANCCSDCKRSRFAFGLYLSYKEEDSSPGFDGRHRICMKHQNYSHVQSFNKLWHKDVRVCMPGTRVPSCFRHRTTDATCHITIQLPSPCLLGFAFCVILSSDLDLTSRTTEDQTLVFVDCKLDLEDSWHKSYLSGYMFPDIQMKLFSDTVFLWYDAETSYEILEDAREKRSTVQGTTYNTKLSFHFSGINGIKECGVWPIYESDLEPEKKKKKKKNLKRKRKTSPILWHCIWQTLITRRIKKSKKRRLSKDRKQVQTNTSFTSRKRARISDTCTIEEVHEI